MVDGEVMFSRRGPIAAAWVYNPSSYSGFQNATKGAGDGRPVQTIQPVGSSGTWRLSGSGKLPPRGELHPLAQLYMQRDSGNHKLPQHSLTGVFPPRPQTGYP